MITKTTFKSPPKKADKVFPNPERIIPKKTSKFEIRFPDSDKLSAEGKLSGFMPPRNDAPWGIYSDMTGKICVISTTKTGRKK